MKRILTVVVIVTIFMIPMNVPLFPLIPSWVVVVEQGLENDFRINFMFII